MRTDQSRQHVDGAPRSGRCQQRQSPGAHPEFVDRRRTFGASAIDMRSDARKIATICASVNGRYRIRSSVQKEPFFQKPMDRKTGSGQSEIFACFEKYWQVC